MTCPLHPDQAKPCPVCGIARVRSALAVAPRPPAPPIKPHTIRDAAIARAQRERLEATRRRADKDTQP